MRKTVWENGKDKADRLARKARLAIALLVLIGALAATAIYSFAAGIKILKTDIGGAGQGPCMSDKIVDDMFRDSGYRSEEWVGVEGSESQLAIFSPWKCSEPKIVFCTNVANAIWKCDF